MQTFSITWDYRCPFARNAVEHVLDGLAAGADWDVTFVPFSLGQVHVADGDPTIWDRPTDDSGLLALQVGTTVRDREPQRFPAVHRDLFALRHDRAGDLRDRDALRAMLERHGVDTDAVFTDVEDGTALKTVRSEHEAAAAEHDVWGVPTFVSGDQAAFVRLMDRPTDDPAVAVATIERILGLLDGVVDLNEFKRTTIPW
jgi:2-hydroxychromene-2-carboxylate isomerase